MKNKIRLEIRKLIKEALESDYEIAKNILSHYNKIGYNKSERNVLSVNAVNFNTEDLYKKGDDKSIDGTFEFNTSVEDYTLVFIGSFESLIYVNKDAEIDSEAGMEIFGAEVNADINVNIESISLGGNSIDIEINILEDKSLSSELIETIEANIAEELKEKLT